MRAGPGLLVAKATLSWRLSVFPTSGSGPGPWRTERRTCPEHRPSTSRPVEEAVPPGTKGPAPPRSVTGARRTGRGFQQPSARDLGFPEKSFEAGKGHNFTEHSWEALGTHMAICHPSGRGQPSRSSHRLPGHREAREGARPLLLLAHGPRAPPWTPRAVWGSLGTTRVTDSSPPGRTTAPWLDGTSHQVGP